MIFLIYKIHKIHFRFVWYVCVCVCVCVGVCVCGGVRVVCLVCISGVVEECILLLNEVYYVSMFSYT